MNYLIEIGIIILFLISLYFSYKIKKIDLLIYSTIFALIFENLNIILFHNTSGGYYYSTNFLMIFNVPLFVILAWGIIILSSYFISEKISKNKKQMIFIFPLIVVMIDLAFESSAVAMGLWTWNLEIYNGFLTIPAENFIGWILVSLGFIVSYKYLNKKYLSIIAAYILFILFSVIPFSISQILNLNNIGNFIILFFIIITLLILYFKFDEKKKIDKIKNEDLLFIISLRLPFYLFPLIFISYWIFDLFSIFIYVFVLIVEILMWIYVKKAKFIYNN